MLGNIPFLDLFFTAYVECALWSSTDDNGHPMDRTFKDTDLAPETVSKMQRDCLKFYTENNLQDFGNHELKQAGHDFWLSRCGHGSGFFDSDLPEPQRTLLQDAARHFGNCDLYKGDDGKLYVSP